MDWSIQDVAKLTGTTSRTLRHYGAIGLLAATRTGAGGARHYDENALVRLQRILLLREFGLSLPHIAEVLDASTSEEQALRAHIDALRRETRRIERQIAAIEKTIEAREGGESLMAHDMFDGFDHTEYEAEVTERWGADAYARGDAWWRGMGADEKSAWKARAAELVRDWVAAAESGVAPDSPRAHGLAKRHVAWLTAVPGTPAAEADADVDAYVLGLADMYVGDPRFARTYETRQGGTAGAEFVRDTLRAFVASRG